VGKTNDAIALDLHRGVALAIALERRSVPMEHPAIGLHHQPTGRPKSINLFAKYDCPGGRQWQVVFATQVEHPILESRLGDLRNLHSIDQTANWAKCPASRRTCANGLELSDPEVTKAIGLLGGSP